MKKSKTKKVIRKIKAKKKPAKSKAKKSKKISEPKIQKTQGKLVGSVTHYFSDISVGVIKLLGPIKEGDEIRIIGGENTDFNQKINSMQVDHKQVKKANKGDDVGLKVKEKVREGYKVYKI